MISNQSTNIEDLSNNNLIKLDWAKFIREKYATNPHPSFTNPKIVLSNTNIKCDDSITSVGSTTTIDKISKRNPYQSTDVSYHLFSQSKCILNESNSKNVSQQIHRSISTSDCVDWTNHQSKTSSIVNNQLNTIGFLREYLQNGNSDVLIDLLDEIAQEINPHSYSAMNNNHFHSSSIFNSNLQLSNNKEKKNKKEKSDEKEKKDDTEIETKKSKKTKTKKIEESSTTDSESVVHSPYLISPKSSSYSPVETTGFSSLSIPVPHTAGSSTQGFSSPESSRIHLPQQSNIAHLSQVQHQLQTDPQNPSLNRTTYSHPVSVQQQLQSLTQMARDGDEILITLSVNALTQKQQRNNNTNPIQQNQLSFQTNSYTPQTWNPMISPSIGMTMPQNLEIVAKGFARVQYEHPPLPPSNPYLQQPSMMPIYSPQSQMLVHPPFAPRYSMPCHWSSGPPQVPIAPPIQPIFASPTITMPDGFNRAPNPADFTSSRRNYSDDHHHRTPINTGKCDYICQSSLIQPDFRGRPSPGVTINPYMSPSPSPMNYSAKQSSKHSSRKHQSYNLNFEDINRTYSSIY